MPAISPDVVLLNILRAAYHEPSQFTDAQEFYKGLQSSIDPQVIDTYAASGVSLNLLLPLLISEITIEEPDKVRILRNTGSTEESYVDFRRVIAELVRMGFHIETKLSKQAFFCFRNQEKAFLNKDYIELPKDNRIQTLLIRIPGAPPVSFRMRPCGTEGKSYANVAFTLRSVEQIFLFLGEVVETQLSRNDGEPPPLVVYDPTNPVPEYLFRVERRTPLNGEISANLHGITYTVAADQTGADASNRVLTILTELVAHQSSTKNQLDTGTTSTP